MSKTSKIVMPAFPFLGVHFTPRINGEVKLDN
jgi:hypothetical protein